MNVRINLREYKDSDFNSSRGGSSLPVPCLSELRTARLLGYLEVRNSVYRYLNLLCFSVCFDVPVRPLSKSDSAKGSGVKYSS